MIEKKYLKSKPICKVKFVLPKEVVNGAKKVALVGDFNDWDEDANPMRKQKSGVYASTVDLNKDQEYQFRYLIDGDRWENDVEADSLVPSPVGDSQNCVVAV